MDDDLRIGLWNALTICYWDPMKKDVWLHKNRSIKVLCMRLWLDYFNEPLDTMDDYWPDVYTKIRQRFFNYMWNEVYDFIQFVANTYTDEGDLKINGTFMTYCNSVLQREVAAYRFVDGKITQLTSEIEIAETEDAIKNAPKPVTTHLKRALELLEDRKSPDYRNSIKESISAVEAICKLIAKTPKTELRDALKAIEKGQIVGLHRELKDAFVHLYSYTSDADGIRHSLLVEPNLDFEDAKFMLVSCSTFINYLIIKASKAGIKL